MSNNGKDKEGQVKKRCPFMGEWCVGEACAIHSYLMRNTPGGVQKIPVCGFEAMVIMLSEINQKTERSSQPDKPHIVLPFMGRG